MAHSFIHRAPVQALALAVTTVIGPMSFAQPAPATAAADALVDGAVRGDAAVRRLGAALPFVAAAHDMSGDALADLLRRDDALWITPGADAYYACFEGQVHGADDASTATGLTPPFACSSPSELALDDTFLLESLPSATKTIYLDFDGHHSVDDGWGHDIVFPAYNTSGSPASFSDGELLEIQGIWWRVTEDFAPFNINVTTRDPGLAALTKSGGGDDTFGVRCVMTQATDGFGDGIGGVAYLNSFNSAVDTPVFGFNKGMNNGSMTASHEVGHALGLHHDGLYGQTYHPGDGFGETGWGPIMGAPFGQNVVRWSNGDYAGSTATEDDLAIITKPENGVDIRADDQPDLFTGLSTLEPDVAVDGLVESGFDVDAFRLATAGGQVTVEVHPLDPGPNIDLRMKVHDFTEALVMVLDPDDDLDVVLDTELPAGVYVVRIHGTGNPGVYSEYGSIGQYCITAHYTPGSDCPADLDGSGDVAVADLLQVLAAWGSAGGDVTGDGTTDVADLLAVLSAWGACA